MKKNSQKQVLQKWFCELCKKSGKVNFKKGTDVSSVIELIAQNHTKTSPKCPQSRYDLKCPETINLEFSSIDSERMLISYPSNSEQVMVLKESWAADKEMWSVDLLDEEGRADGRLVGCRSKREAIGAAIRWLIKDKPSQ